MNFDFSARRSLEKPQKTGVSWYDYGFRFYDPQIGRFPSLDPKADAFVELSPYNYASNSPVAKVDLWGLQGEWFFEVGPMLEKEAIKQGYAKDNGSFPTMQNAVKYSDRPEKQAQIDAYATAGALGLAEIGGALLVPALTETKLGQAVIKFFSGNTDDAVKATSLETRAKEIHSALPEATQNRTTTAVAEVTNANGTKSTLVGSSEKVLRPSQRAVLNSGENAVSGSGHAEVTVINAANQNGQTVNRVAASRPICPECEEAIRNAGATPASPLK